MRAAAAIVLVCWAAAATAAEPAQVFGLPLGGKMPQTIKRCTAPLEVSVPSTCWSYMPERQKDGGFSGLLRMPESTLPKWAEFAGFELRLNSARELESILVTLPHDNWRSIVSSIGSRFGDYSEITELASPPAVKVAWTRASAFIEVFCHSERCKVTFTTVEKHEQRQRAAEDRRKADAARPVAP